MDIISEFDFLRRESSHLSILFSNLVISHTASCYLIVIVLIRSCLIQTISVWSTLIKSNQSIVPCYKPASIWKSQHLWVIFFFGVSTWVFHICAKNHQRVSTWILGCLDSAFGCIHWRSFSRAWDSHSPLYYTIDNVLYIYTYWYISTMIQPYYWETIIVLYYTLWWFLIAD